MDSKIKIGIIRVLTLKDKYALENHARIIDEDGKFGESIEFVSRCIEDQPFGIHDDETLNTAVPKIVELAKQMEKENSDGIVISCCADPGLKEVEKEVKIPVISAGRECSEKALKLGKKIIAIGITAEATEHLKELLGNNLFDYYNPENINSTLDLNSKRGRKSVVDSAKKAYRCGSDCIMICCTGMSNIKIAEEIRSSVDIKVADPLEAIASKIKKVYDL
ncbi:aspartate/glutamate racemase family protein [Clostridium sp. HV4-5-A1G]|uniref:aspartate/glutamate racemase family protein n=1 Tax=Clostridium sp. HV4-5-A1G TaxID=2004595 RepID=UPI00123A68A2|nr:aspartate/glutamate racemase family protein [Clostridium sp. HV4-5-A1G]KAA8668871.1 hydantoin racemase [Clostridium sp. HV4-5-A1G]